MKMKIPCPNCDKTLSSKIGEHEYTESGLQNVILQNIKIYECECGISIPSIYRADLLDDALAGEILSKPTLLNGAEIRFLRKNIPMAALKVAKLIGIDKTTFSKWENDNQSHRESNDRHIRSMYMLHKGFSTNDVKAVFNHLSRIKLKEQIQDVILTAEKIGNEYFVSSTYVFAVQSYEVAHQVVCMDECILATALPKWTVQGSFEFVSKEFNGTVRLPPIRRHATLVYGGDIAQLRSYQKDICYYDNLLISDEQWFSQLPGEEVEAIWPDESQSLTIQ